MNSTEKLLDRHLECFGKGDLDGIVADLLVGGSHVYAARSTQGTRCAFGRSFRRSLRSLENLA